MRRVFHRRRPEGGAVAVEAALVLPLLLIMILGIVEMSLFMRDVMAASSAVRVGDRVASVSPNAGPAICPPATPTSPPCTPTTAPALAQAAANAIQHAGSAMPSNEINSIMVYQANPDGYPLPNGNKTLVCSSNCVNYRWDPTLNGGQFRYNGGTWDSTGIDSCVNDPLAQFVGVSMNATHPFITHLFGASVQINERSVMQFEPQPIASCQPKTHL